jgi:phosphocarrier protein
MKEIKYTITDPLGIHARPAGLIVKLAAGFKSAITLDNGAKKADAKRIMAVMSMGTKQGNEITVTVDGEDEDAAAAAIETFLKENL